MTTLAIILAKGMFGSEFNPTSRAFGLTCGQMRPSTHNCRECGLNRRDGTRVSGPAHRVPSKASYEWWIRRMTLPLRDGWREVYPVAYCHCTHFVTPCEKVTHNSSWYNDKGEKLGWGDLCVCDMLRIAAECKETFYILPESVSFWDFVKKNPGTIGAECATSADIDAPGIEFVRKHAMWVITPAGNGVEMCSIINISNYGTKVGEANSKSWGSMTYIQCHRDDMEKYVNPAPIVAPKVRARIIPTTAIASCPVSALTLTLSDRSETTTKKDKRTHMDQQTNQVGGIIPSASDVGSSATLKTKRGFGAMDPNRVKEIASKGGKAAHMKGTAHQFNSEEARIAGSKGGKAPRKSRKVVQPIESRGDAE